MHFTRLTFACALLALPATAQQLDRHSPMDFQGRYLVSVSDADMIASAYVNGRLGPREGADAISVLSLDGDPRNWTAVEQPASNSVAGPPNAVTLSPDGRYAVVIETWTPRPDTDGAHTFADLRHGSLVSVFDLVDPTSPELVQTHETLERPDAATFNHDGSLLAISFHPAGAGQQTPLALYRFEDGQISDRATPQIPDWPTTGRLIDVAFHPTENVLAVIDSNGGATLRFLSINDDRSVDTIGNAVDLERAPFRVLWTPDGQHIVVNAVYWGPDIAGRWIEAPRGSVSTVRYSAQTRDDGSVRHAFVSRAMTGVSPEGLAISPDGTWVATTNLERSYLPYEDPRITWFSSITLARLDPTTGQLSHAQTFNYDGILPEAAQFDNSSTYLAVANYDHFDDRKSGGSIDFWRIQADPLDVSNVQLVRTEHSVPVTRGAHSLAIAR